TSFQTRDALHPIRYAAAVLFDDGTVETASQLKALEYGATADAVVQLVATMQQKRRAAVGARYVMQVDQFGNLHAPFAMARSILAEHGHGEVIVLVHSA
ncbi:unnamed protein product, partial [Phaeothamnion confervicola]